MSILGDSKKSALAGTEAVSSALVVCVTIHVANAQRSPGVWIGHHPRPARTDAIAGTRNQGGRAWVLETWAPDTRDAFERPDKAPRFNGGSIPHETASSGAAPTCDVRASRWAPRPIGIEPASLAGISSGTTGSAKAAFVVRRYWSRASLEQTTIVHKLHSSRALQRTL